MVVNSLCGRHFRGTTAGNREATRISLPGPHRSKAIQVCALYDALKAQVPAPCQGVVFRPLLAKCVRQEYRRWRGKRTVGSAFCQDQAVDTDSIAAGPESAHVAWSMSVVLGSAAEPTGTIRAGGGGVPVTEVVVPAAEKAVAGAYRHQARGPAMCVAAAQEMKSVNSSLASVSTHAAPFNFL
jgi:hypothetical protein